MDELEIYKEALRLMAIDYIDTMVSEAAFEWTENDLGGKMKPRVNEGPIFDEFVQRYIKEAKNGTSK